MDALLMLGTIEEQADMARGALRDEHEGDFRRYVEALAEQAIELRDLVQNW